MINPPKKPKDRKFLIIRLNKVESPDHNTTWVPDPSVKPEERLIKGEEPFMDTFKGLIEEIKDLNSKVLVLYDGTVQYRLVEDKETN